VPHTHIYIYNTHVHKYDDTKCKSFYNTKFRVRTAQRTDTITQANQKKLCSGLIAVFVRTTWNTQTRGVGT
jgi:hypothetical protein